LAIFIVYAFAVMQVQSKVGLKYDAWHKEVVSKFGNMLGAEMVEFHGQVSKVIYAAV